MFSSFHARADYSSPEYLRNIHLLQAIPIYIYIYIYIFFFLFPLVKHLWESLAIKTLSDLCVYIRHWLWYISNLGSRGTFASHIKALPLVALITSLFFISVFFDTTRVLPILPVAVFLIKNINAFSATSQVVRKPRTLFRHHQHSVGILWTIILFHASRPDIAFKRSSLLFSYLTYRKIPKISPSMYKPLKPVTQKTLR